MSGSPPRKRRRASTPGRGARVPPPAPAPRYDFAALAAAHPDILGPFVVRGARGATVDFSAPGATLAVTRATLRAHFRLSLTLPPGALVPTVPGRAQYLAWAAALVPAARAAERASLLDVGTGPAAVYALLAARTLPGCWAVTATDTDAGAAAAAAANVADNGLGGRVAVLARGAEDALVPPPACFARRGAPPLALVVCNPPFYGAGETPRDAPPPGTRAQLETPGGEVEFLLRLARDGRAHGAGPWFTSVVGVKSDLGAIKRGLRAPEVGAVDFAWVRLSPGGRTVRWAVAWRYADAQDGGDADAGREREKGSGVGQKREACGQ